jgi:predicted O-methyltransferase YrrM
MKHSNINKILRDIINTEKEDVQSAEVETTDFLVNLISLMSATKILEIGTHMGYTALKILASNNKALVTTIDFGEKYKPFIKHLPKDIKSRVTFIHLSAGEYYSKMKRINLTLLLLMLIIHTLQLLEISFISYLT